MTKAIESYGQIVILDDLRPGHVKQFAWRPSDTFCHLFPIGFQLTLAFYKDGSGFNRIRPVNVQTFLIQAALLGQNILEATGHFSEERVASSNILRLLFQQRHCINETAHRTFQRKSDLLISASGRLCESDWTLLPDFLGHESDHTGKTWSLDELIRNGQEQAKAWGTPELDLATIVRCGLHRAALNAHINLDRLSLNEVRSQYRMALFCDDHELVPASVRKTGKSRIDDFQDRFAGAIEMHLSDSTEKFSEWFFQRSDGVIHQIAKRKSGGGPIDRRVVRELRLQMLLYAYEEMALCVHVAMTEILRLLPVALTASEVEYHHKIFLREDFAGSLPLIFLHDRLKSIGINLFHVTPESVDSSVLLRLLNYYSEMTVKRRAADRRIKTRQQEDAKQRSAVDKTPDLTTQEKSGLRQKLATVLGFDCSCICPDRDESWTVTDAANTESKCGERVLLCKVCGKLSDVLTDEQVMEVFRNAQRQL